MPLISVIVPVYNVQDYLEECLNSILNQTFKDIEIICINDGSVDGSIAILEKYAQKDKRIILLNLENKGQAAARNIGLKTSKGKYISFVDSDDVINTRMFEVLIPLFSDDIDAVVFEANLFGESDNLMQKYFRPRFKGKHKICGKIILGCQVPPWNKIYRKDIIDKYQISFPDGLLYEDNSFHWKYLMHTENVYFYPNKLYNYRIRKNSIMYKTKNTKIADLCLVCSEIFEYMEKCNLTKEYSEFFVNFFEHCLEIVCANTNNLQKSIKTANEIWSKINVKTDNAIISALARKNYDYVIKWIGYSFSEKIFSIKKRYGKKTVTVCGKQFFL
jgi:glycosyltransferase involved in cell wall biosynthesis